VGEEEAVEILGDWRDDKKRYGETYGRRRRRVCVDFD